MVWFFLLSHSGYMLDVEWVKDVLEGVQCLRETACLRKDLFCMLWNFFSQDGLLQGFLEERGLIMGFGDHLLECLVV